MKYFILKDNQILSYVGAYIWLSTSEVGHHRMATDFNHNDPATSPSFRASLRAFITGSIGSMTDEEFSAIQVTMKDSYFKAEEEKLTSPWSLAAAMIRTGAKRILLYGPPGVGKSFTPWKEAQAAGANFHSVTLTDMTPMAELRGHFVIKGSDTVWHDGILSRAWRDSQTNRTIMVLNEIDHVGADAESFLHNFLDDPEMARIYLPNGEQLVPGNIQVVATMNGDPEDLADALRDRFTVRVRINDPHPDALAALPKELQAFAKRMILSPPAGQERMSLRALNDFVRLVEGVDRSSGSVAQAARAIFGIHGDDVVQALRVGTAK